MSNVRWLSNRLMQVIDASGYPLYLTPEMVREVAEAYELLNAIEDVKSRCAGQFDGGGTDENGTPLYDAEKYPLETLSTLARKVIQRRDNSDSVGEAYWDIVDWVLDDYDGER
jgi:hypothetical protein